MRAKYAGTCTICRRRIEPGEEIRSGGDSAAWSHAVCLPGLFETPARSAPPATVRRRSRPPDQPLPAGATAVYTDGACAGNPGPGGWAWAVGDGRRGSGSEAHTTNQRMEIRAALEAVRAVPDSPLVVVSDSTYVVNCFRDAWWRGWLARGWLTAAKQPVANRDLWEPLVELVNRRGDVTFSWVKGHSGDPMNDLVDALAVQATAEQAGGDAGGLAG